MSRAPDWTRDEFEFLLSHYDLSPEQLQEQGLDRTTGAVQWVRSGIHRYHSGDNDHGILSGLQRAYLDENLGHWTCHTCRKSF